MIFSHLVCNKRHEYNHGRKTCGRIGKEEKRPSLNLQVIIIVIRLNLPGIHLCLAHLHTPLTAHQPELIFH